MRTCRGRYGTRWETMRSPSSRRKVKQNGELLRLLEGRFDVFVTSDGSVEHQQNLIDRRFSIIVVPTNDLAVLSANARAIRTTLDESQPKTRTRS
jgi:hypothetical protein